MTCTLIQLKTRERTELPNRPKGHNPYVDDYIRLWRAAWAAQTRIAAEYAAAVFGADTHRDGAPSDSPTDAA
jgi:hypothetical protein